MKTFRLSLAAALAATAVALLPATATADDASVYAAYNGHQQEFKDAAAAYRRAVRQAKRAGRKVTDDQLRAIISADQQINNVLVAVTNDVKGQQASTKGGERARTYALRNLVLFKKANDFEIESYQQMIDGHLHASDVAYARGLRTLRRSSRYSKLATRQFGKLGLPS
jgi:hypothetical protein